MTVCGSVRIGEGSIIGAGSTVTKDIPAGVIAADKLNPDGDSLFAPLFPLLFRYTPKTRQLFRS